MLKLGYGWKKILHYKNQEIRDFFITVFVAGFVLSIRSFIYSIQTGIFNFIMFTILFGIAYFLFVSTQKWIAYSRGYEGTYSNWKFGPFLGFLLSMYLIMFFPDEKLFYLVLLYLGNVSIKDIPHLRLGEHRKSINMKDMMIVGLAGPIMMLILTVILMPLYSATGADSFKYMLIFSSLILFFSALPLPSMNGINILIKSRMGWVFYFFFCLVFMILVAVVLASWNIWIYFVALVIAALLAYIFKKYFVPKLHS
ncbi:hypothetical protein K9L67_04020 [Candidatus Woesearchaeota archaeon]|nr:hypothetical protein [Candidatus Woesearchaeota archaeon]MCF7901368.1 hypothetical protein [Candidatus Woesearchaeota archaeon]MCF8013368.1 hypothetical protein [Candidatus Woesearchaeota archaeon]